MQLEEDQTTRKFGEASHRSATGYSILGPRFYFHNSSVKNELNLVEQNPEEIFVSIKFCPTQLT